MNDSDEKSDTVVEKNMAHAGAAADSAENDEPLKLLPRILRYAVMLNRDTGLVRERLIADIGELSPEVGTATALAADADADQGIALAAELDHLAVTKDKPGLRSLADCVRLLVLPALIQDRYRDAHLRLSKALMQALRALPLETDVTLASEIEAICLGWATLPVTAGASFGRFHSSAYEAVSMVAGGVAYWQTQAAKRTIRTGFAEKEQVVQDWDSELSNPMEAAPLCPVQSEGDAIVICRIDKIAMKNSKLRDLIEPLRHVVNVSLPLVEVPPIHEVRSTLLFEFPYAENVIDFALADLVGRRTVQLRPLLLVGEPGGGKSRFARRLGEILGVGTWRTDASRSDGAIFGGTDKRWYSAEPCHPLLAVAQARHGNPLILIDELDKAGTRSDYGRFWDCLLSFLEPETAGRYQDPALQTTLDLSHVSYVATANFLEPLPSPLRDRFRIVTFPKPDAQHLDALLAPIVADLTNERGLDQRWAEPLASLERDVVAAQWKGGSVRQLRRITEAVLHAREKAATRN